MPHREGGWAAAVYELSLQGEAEHVVWHPQPALAEADYLLRCLSVRRPGYIRLVTHPDHGSEVWPGMFMADEPANAKLGMREAHPGRRAAWGPVDGLWHLPVAPWRHPTPAMLTGLLGALQLDAAELAARSGLSLTRVRRLELGGLPSHDEDSRLRRALAARWAAHRDGSAPIRPLGALEDRDA